MYKNISCKLNIKDGSAAVAGFVESDKKMIAE